MLFYTLKDVVRLRILRERVYLGLFMRILTATFVVTYYSILRNLIQYYMTLRAMDVFQERKRHILLGLIVE